MVSPDGILSLASRYVGTVENPKGSNRNPFALIAGHANSLPWCATFLVALARLVGLDLPTGALSAYTPTQADAFKRAGRWSTVPVVGAFAFFDFPDKTFRIQHCGIVERVVSAHTIQTIEGNTSSGNVGSQDNGGVVARRLRSTAYVVGYGLPVYTQGSGFAPAVVEDEMTPEQIRQLTETAAGVNAIITKIDQGNMMYVSEKVQAVITKCDYLLYEVSVLKDRIAAIDGGPDGANLKEIVDEIGRRLATPEQGHTAA